MPPTPPGSGSSAADLADQVAIRTIVNGGATPNAWNVASSDELSNSQ